MLREQSQSTTFLHREGAADTNKKRKKKEKQLLLLKLGLYNQIKDEA